MREKSRPERRAIPTFPLVALLLIPLFPAVFAALAAENRGTESIIDRLQQRYESTDDYVADFVQETVLKTLNRSVKARGKVSFKRPGKMLWRYDDPKGQLVLADGTHLYYYQPEQKQVIKSRLTSAFRSDLPYSFLLGIGDLKRDFDIAHVGSEKGHHVLRFAPKKGLEGIGEFFLGIDRKAFEIVWARIEDTVGNIITIRFSNIERGVGLGDALFDLQVPEEVDIVELGS